VKDDVVRTMLGTGRSRLRVSHRRRAAANDGPALLGESDVLAERGLSSAQALEALASLFHRIAVAQVVPDAVKAFDDADRVSAFASRFSAETVQLYYQIAAQGRADLEIAPDEATAWR
jgi:DNA polymerase-3 subunit gamma/tau